MTALQQPPPLDADAGGHPVLDVRGLRVARDDGATIVSQVDLQLGAGETLGIVGESGSGKSITARAIIGLLPERLRASGQVRYDGQDLLPLSEARLRREIRGHGIGLIMQDPFTMLNPGMRCGDIIAESLAAPTSRRTSEGRAEAIRRLAEVGITDPSVARRYPFQLSGGMRQRVAIAAALARDPQVLIADEPTTALDATTQREILALIQGIQQARKMTLILITHDLRVAFALCDRVHVMYAGSVVETGTAEQLEREPRHPYTQALLLSEPPVDRRVGALTSIPGAVPAPDDVADQCVFAPRCFWATDVCRDSAPTLAVLAENRASACVRWEEIREPMGASRRAPENLPVQVRGVAERSAVITARELSKVFVGDKGHLVDALQGVSIEVAENEGVGIVGESGSGKTTLARILVGLEQSTSGTLTIDGVDASDWKRASKSDLQTVRNAVQMVFQDPYSSLNPMRTVGWALSEAVRLRQDRSTDVDAEVVRLLDTVGLPPEVARRRPAALSGGMRQRVAIARALAGSPKVLICDESVSSLDVSVQAQILNLLSRLRDERGIGYLFITHDLAVVRQVTERIYVMHHGRVVEAGRTDDVVGDPQDPYTAQLLAAAPRLGPRWLASADQAPHA